MGINGKAGHGRGNNRKRPHKRRENDNEVWQKGNYSGWESNRQVTSRRSEMGGEQGKASGRISEQQAGKSSNHKRNGERGERTPYFERPKWIPPKMNTDPLPVSDCPWCGKPIRDMSSAIADKDTGAPVHFDCVVSRITFGEKLEKGDTVTYIGGGRFGIISFDGSSMHTKDSNKDSNAKPQGNQQASGRQEPDRKPSASSQTNRDFIIKKIIEWESNGSRADWRSAICDHFSVI